MTDSEQVGPRIVGILEEINITQAMVAARAVHTWDDATPSVTRCGKPIRTGVLTTVNRYGVTCPRCQPRRRIR